MDEEFLYRLPQTLSLMTWEWTGGLELRRDTCERLGYPQPPKPVDIGKQVLLQGGAIGYRSCTNKIDLQRSVVYDWRNEMIRAAGSKPALVLKFDNVKPYLIDHWNDYNI